MNWQQAQRRILNIEIGTHIDTDSEYRYIIQGPDYRCNTYNYNGANGFRINIGETNFINIPINMLETLFNASITNNRIYNTSIFQQNFQRQYKTHGCHVHVVGKLFETAHVAVKINSQDFRIL